MAEISNAEVTETQNKKQGKKTNEEDRVEEQQRKPKKKKKSWLFIITIIVSILILCYLGISLFFETHYYPGTVINGITCSQKSQDEVKDIILNRTKSYSLTILGRDDLVDEISGDEINLQFEFDDNFLKIKNEQNGFAWISFLWSDNTYSLPNVAVYDDGAFELIVSKLVFFDKENCIKPENAYLSEYNRESKSFNIVDEVEGTTLKPDETLEAISEAVKSLNNEINLEEEGCYEEPEITADDPNLKKDVEALNTYVSAAITYDWNGVTEVVDGDMISEWVELKAGRVVLDEEAVKDYVSSKAKEHDTYGKVRTVITYSGETKELRSGAYGWKTDKDAETAELIDEIKNGEVISKEPQYSMVAASKGEDDIGSSYVEINLSLQHLYVIIDGTVVYESDFVSGNMSNGCGTPAGVFGITYKTKDATLKGENYESHVAYWMPFNGNIGMHDANWRSSFGGEIYLTSGSHGCVNLPVSAAAEIYNYVSTGFPIVCYY